MTLSAKKFDLTEILLWCLKSLYHSDKVIELKWVIVITHCLVSSSVCSLYSSGDGPDMLKHSRMCSYVHSMVVQYLLPCMNSHYRSYRCKRICNL